MLFSRIITSNLRNSLNFLANAKRCASTVQRLSGRSLVKVCGAEVDVFLQGLITNDMRHLEHNNCFYTMFLSAKGRVLYDTIIYKAEGGVLIECDRRARDSFEKHLKMYRMKKKIDVSSVEDDVFVAFDESGDSVFNECESYKDPRLARLGYRIIANSSKKFTNISRMDSDEYRVFRYRLGVPEGSLEMPPNETMPLEMNCDYLHGVSFQKGCYIGQELTARTHHTGVLRRRIMPLTFENDSSLQIEYDTPVYSSENHKKSIGKVKAVYGNVGIALLRISEALEAPHLVIGDRKAKTVKPEWWPIELPKDKASVGK